MDLMKTWTTAVLVLGMAASAAAQNCRPALRLEPPLADQWTLEELATGQTIRLPFRVAVEADVSECGFLVGFDLVHSQQVEVHVERRPFSQPLLDIDVSDPRRLLSGVANPGAGAAFDLDLVVTPRPGLDARRVNVQLTARTYAGRDPANAVQSERIRERVGLEVPAYARVLVQSDAGEQPLGASASFVSLGDLISGGRGRATLQLQGNVPVTVGMQPRRGRLVHREFPEYTVPYRLSVAGRIVSGGSAYVRMKPGESTQLRIEVGEVENVVAGDYQDVLLLTVSPN